MTTRRPSGRVRGPVTRPSRNGSRLVHSSGKAALVFTLTLDAPALGVARLRLAGHLDGEAAREVLHAAADVVRWGCSRLVLDLGGLASWDDDATYAVVGCTRLARWLPEGAEVVADDELRRLLLPPQAEPVTSAALGRGADTMAACHAS